MSTYKDIYDIVEPKIQVEDTEPKNRRDHEILQDAINLLIRAGKGMADAIGNLTGDVSGGDSGGGSSGGSTTASISLIYEAPVTLAEQATGTEDAWTTINAGTSATYAMIQFHMFSTNDSAGGQMSWRSASGQPEIIAGAIRADGVSDADRDFRAWFFVPLTNGSFDYKTDTTAGTVSWEILRIGTVA